MLGEGQCDVVCGSRFLGTKSNVPRVRKIILKTVIGLSNLTAGTKVTDVHNGLRALSRKAASCLNISQSGMAHASEIMSQLRFHKMSHPRGTRLIAGVPGLVIQGCGAMPNHDRMVCAISVTRTFGRTSSSARPAE